MECGLCKAAIKDQLERHGTMSVPRASQVVDPEFEGWYKEMQLRYPCMEGQNVFTCLPATYEIPVCLGCCVNLFRAAGLGWREYESLNREAR